MPEYSPKRERELLNLLAEGNEFAFKQIYDCYWYSIYKTVKRFTKSSFLAEDIVQEIFATLWKRRTSFGEVLQLEYYLISMARNLTYRTLRRMAFEEDVKNTLTREATVVESIGDDFLLDQQYQQLLQQAVRLLPSQQKQVFHLAKVEGLSHRDIAAQMNISHLTVKTHMAKALQFIRHYLQPHLGHYLFCLLLYRVLVLS
ncbi:MAG TPA: RNA polymerase sigma-70 factor [Cyclobacteriaceae bacterium]|nr:RNA polymerase sigma-70 factor [Cyclobacteriaceae bacterium]